jgi:2-(1,2-epoxy-1,2-dihydrophenyl)acetyl-CoA isomerase
LAYEDLMLEVSEGIATITLNRPQAFNAMSLQTARELCDVANRIGDDKAVRAILITGAGRSAFCAGGDVGAFAQAGRDVALLIKEMTGFFHLAISRFARSHAPVIAVVNGVAAGAGLSLVAACDLVIAADTAIFTSAYTKIGFSPDGSSSYFLPRILGIRRTAELYMTNRVLSAAEGLEWGLVNRVVPAGELTQSARAWAQELAAGPTVAYGGVKRLLLNSFTDTLESQMEHETRVIAEMATNTDGREGVRAFIEKRKPKFVGR